MSTTTKTEMLLEQARTLAAAGIPWPDFSNRMFDQTKGLVAKSFADPMERQAFYDSHAYKEIHEMMAALMRRQGVAAPPKSGKFVVRIPRTVHEELDVEAKREGVSLNQLVMAKLAFPLRERIRLDVDLVVRAFADVHNGYAPDRVVVDPELDARYLARCFELGLEDSPYVLNHALFDIRKSSKARLPATSRKTEFRDLDDYQYGSEIAVRMLQKTEGVSLDRILCDPDLVAKFDQIAAGMVSEKSALKRRWAALNLRKTRRLQPTDLAGPTYQLVSVGPVKTIPLNSLPMKPATYAFFDQNRPIFAGETDNLKRRIELHLSAQRTSNLFNTKTIVLKQFVADKLSSTERQRWLRHFINDERPLLNYQKAG